MVQTTGPAQPSFPPLRSYPSHSTPSFPRAGPFASPHPMLQFRPVATSLHITLAKFPPSPSPSRPSPHSLPPLCWRPFAAFCVPLTPSPCPACRQCLDLACAPAFVALFSLLRPCSPPAPLCSSAVALACGSPPPGRSPSWSVLPPPLPAVDSLPPGHPRPFCGRLSGAAAR